MKSSKRSAPAITLELKPSRWWRGWVLASHTVALLALAIAALPLAARGALIIPLIASVLLCWRLEPTRRYSALHWFADGGVELKRRDGSIESFERLQSELARPFLTTLELCQDGKIRRRFALFSDSAGTEDLRMLRVRLRLTIEPNAAPEREI
jgi:hypothetical protein